MPFDERRYLAEVLDPAREAGSPPEDLRLRYQLRQDMSPAEVAETVRQVRQCWRRQRQLLKFRKLVDRLESDHAGYAPIFEAAANGDTGPLIAALRQAGERDRRRVTDLRRRLDDAAGRLRLLAPDVVAGIARSAGVERREADALAGQLGIEIREPDQLPDIPPYPGYARAREALDTLRKRHLAEFVLGDTQFRIFTPTGDLGERIREVEADWQRRTRGSWTISADTVLAALRGVDDPGSLLRYDLVARVRERVREHPGDETLVRFAVEDLGLDPGEARRLVFAVRQEGGGPSGPRARLRELVDAGEIQAAADLAATLPEGTELGNEIAARLAAAVKLRDQALTATDPDEAWILLADALRRVPDLPGAAGLLARLAPHPARDVRAEPHDDTVTITWQPSPSRAGEITYEIRRDGVPLRAGPDAGRFVDETPPINVPLRYAVAARRGEATAAAAPAAAVVVRPEPRDLRVTAGDGVVTGRWTAPREAIGVVVLRDGQPVTVDGSAFRDRAVRNGAGHHYHVYAVYPTPDGAGASTPGLHRTVTPHARPEPVPELSITPAPQGLLLITCAEPASGGLEFRLLKGAPPWPYGTTLALAEIQGAGRALAATPVAEGHLIKPETGVVLALTIAGDLVTVGAYREHVNLTAPASVTAERRGGTVLVGLDWPPDVPEVEVGWAAERLLVSAAAYRAQGGIRLDAPEDEAITIEVVPSALLRGERARGPAVRVELPAAVPVRYDLIAEGPPWKRTLTVEVSAERPARVPRLVLVLKPGLVQPLTAADGRVLGEWTDLTAPARLTLPAPRQAKPYWLRCFAEGDVALLDPSVRRMKMG
ncbi:hypothetical protein Aple_050860 [Acrocarpospora pleiomorpha]|uniref:Fibronectin type-III domain-containing protein n=1 Tax=Acrocarpospora pleiomorpha TaxID=90975 RepID=A0A5M3XQ37_9ACTN|nr:hypothetical protein [Acrocarpospora pleiomorpha]GES22189.1 hypothetical protein Aple_050860 [Acrocarpospora pleiomorpha]